MKNEKSRGATPRDTTRFPFGVVSMRKSWAVYIRGVRENNGGRANAALTVELLRRKNRNDPTGKGCVLNINDDNNNNNNIDAGAARETVSPTRPTTTNAREAISAAAARTINLGPSLTLSPPDGRVAQASPIPTASRTTFFFRRRRRTRTYYKPARIFALAILA